MALTDSNMGPADIAAVMGGNGFGGLGGWGNGDFWLILILLFAFGGFGGWGGMGGYGGYGEAALGGAIYPWMNQLEYTQAGFSQQATNTALGNISDAVNAGFAGVNTSLCNGFAGVNQNLSTGFAGVNQSVANGFAQAEIANNSRQIANMQTAFANQTAMNQGFNGVTSQLAQCCCDNRLATAQTQALVQSENCADRAALSDGIRDIITNQTANTQRILDQMCNDKIDAKNERIAELQNQLTLANLAASQNAQTAVIEAGQRALANEVEQYISPNPKPCYVVSSPYCCQSPYYNCGCGA